MQLKQRKNVIAYSHTGTNLNLSKGCRICLPHFEMLVLSWWLKPNQQFATRVPFPYILYKTRRRRKVHRSTKKEKSSSKQFICAAWVQITYTLACFMECQKCSFRLYISDSLIRLRNHFWSISWKSHLNLFYLASREKALMFAFLLLKTVPILLTNVQLVKFSQ